MAQEFTTFEEVEQYVDEHYPEQNVMNAKGGGGGMEQVWKYYNIVKPILRLVLNIPLIPEKIKKPIRDFMDVLDGLNPQGI